MEELGEGEKATLCTLRSLCTLLLPASASADFQDEIAARLGACITGMEVRLYSMILWMLKWQQILISRLTSASMRRNRGSVVIKKLHFGCCILFLFTCGGRIFPKDRCWCHAGHSPSGAFAG